MFEELYIYNYFPTDVGESETRTKEISTLKMAMIHAIMGEDTKALTKDEEVRAFFNERYRRELEVSEESSWDSPYRKLLDELKGTKAYEEALAIPHRARTGRKIEKSHSGVLMFGKKGNDYIFKIGIGDIVEQLTAEQAFALFEALPGEAACDLTKEFDKVYQNVKQNLFKSESKSRNPQELLKAITKIKAMIKTKAITNIDYLKDLLAVAQSDGLSGYEIRFINQLKPDEYSLLPKEIEQEYLSRIIRISSQVEDGEETLILAEEITQA